MFDDDESQRLAALEAVLTETRFMHPALRAKRVDDFYRNRLDRALTEERPPDVLRSRVRKVLMHALERRGHWAHAGGEVNAARAVAYQSIAGYLLRVLDQPEGSS